MSKSSSQTRDYSLVALLTDENSTPSHDQYWIGGNPPKKDPEVNDTDQTPNGEVLESNQGVEGMLEKLANGNGNSRLVSVPVRAQAELLSRIKHVSLQDGNIVMAKGWIMQHASRCDHDTLRSDQVPARQVSSTLSRAHALSPWMGRKSAESTKDSFSVP